MTLGVIACLLTEARVVKLPNIAAASTYGFDVTEVVLTDSVTKLHLVVSGRPDEPGMIAAGSYLLADGHKYMMKRYEKVGDGRIDDGGWEFWIDFDVWFEPMPETTKVFDFVEGEGGDDRKLWDVDLTGSKRQTPAVFNVKERPGAKMPSFKFAMDTVTINLHIVNYKEKMGKRARYCVNSLVGQRNNVKELPEAVVDAKGNCSFKLFVIGTSDIHFINVGECLLYASVRVDPGETVDVWADAGYSGRGAMRQRHLVDKQPAYVSNGRYRDYGLAEAKAKVYYSLNLHSGEFADYHMTADEYTDHTIKVYRDSLARVNADRSLTPFQKSLARSRLAAELIEATAERDYLLKHNYWCTYRNYGTPVPADSLHAVFTAEHTRRVAKAVNINDPALMFEAMSRKVATPIFKEAGVDDRQLCRLAYFLDVYKEAGNKEELDKAALAKLESYKIPFYTRAVKHRHNEVQAAISKYDTKRILSAPAVPDSEIFDAIIAPHKGKVVVIDVWNTWCGPCRADIESHEPLKTSSLSSKDIVWIYLADESSPKDLYVKMVQNISGIHYRLSKSQDNAVADKFGIKFIPSYILVDREGNAVFRKDMGESDEAFEKAILEKL